MRTYVMIAIAVVIVGGFVAYMSSFTVKFTEAAVVTTFGKVGSGGVVRTNGLHFKAPAPIQNVTLYDTRARFLQVESETQQTADNRQIVVEAFMTWNVADPATFYRRFRSQSGTSAREHYVQAESQLTSLLRSAMSEVSNFRLGELFAPGVGQSRLSDLEDAVFQRLISEGADSTLADEDAGSSGAADPAERGNLPQYGINITLVGIDRVVLPEDTTRQVFERMTEARKRLAAKAESEGEALATAIRSEAENNASRIREFVRFRADQIRNQGNLEAAQYFASMNEDPELANFLTSLDLLRNGLGRKVTLVLPSTMPGMVLFGAEAFSAVQQGQLPSVFEGAPSASADPESPRVTETSTPQPEGGSH